MQSSPNIRKPRNPLKLNNFCEKIEKNRLILWYKKNTKLPIMPFRTFHFITFLRILYGDSHLGTNEMGFDGRNILSAMLTRDVYRCIRFYYIISFFTLGTGLKMTHYLLFISHLIGNWVSIYGQRDNTYAWKLKNLAISAMVISRRLSA